MLTRRQFLIGDLTSEHPNVIKHAKRIYLTLPKGRLGTVGARHRRCAPDDRGACTSDAGWGTGLSRPGSLRGQR